jgi:hypothetical protein
MPRANLTIVTYIIVKIYNLKNLLRESYLCQSLEVAFSLTPKLFSSLDLLAGLGLALMVGAGVGLASIVLDKSSAPVSWVFLPSIWRECQPFHFFFKFYS